jgi:hypothetical protein
MRPTLNLMLTMMLASTRLDDLLLLSGDVIVRTCQGYLFIAISFPVLFSLLTSPHSPRFMENDQAAHPINVAATVVVIYTV